MATVLCSNEVSNSLNVEEVMENEVFAFPVSFLLDFSGEPEVGLNVQTNSTAHAQSCREW
jgi:hypothetical protein